jgi:uncharacterized protein YlxW (UPF0749 family)
MPSSQKRGQAVGFFRDGRGKVRPIIQKQGVQKQVSKIVPTMKFKQVSVKDDEDKQLAAKLESAMAKYTQLQDQLTTLKEELKVAKREGQSAIVPRLTVEMKNVEREVTRQLELIRKLKA